jgi:hypothetical protein
MAFSLITFGQFIEANIHLYDHYFKNVLFMLISEKTIKYEFHFWFRLGWSSF